jgi:LysM repeat protein
MKRAFLIGVLVVWCMAGIGQNKILVMGTYPDLFIMHKVTDKETLTALSKVYSTPIQSLSKINSLSADALLSIGQKIKIPLTKNNFTQEGQLEDKQTLVPVYHLVKRNEGLFRISQLYGRVRIDYIRVWNDLVGDAVQVGQKLIIGHLRVARENATDVLVAATSGEEGTDNGYEVKEEKKEPTKETKPVTPVPTNNTDDADEGFFVTQYPSGKKALTQVLKVGEAATFKTTSGWSDKKYYVLMDDVTPGTIVRITIGGKSVCAKVLGSLPEMKENKSLLLRMSNATASALHVSDANFQVQVSFYK